MDNIVLGRKLLAADEDMPAMESLAEVINAHPLAQEIITNNKDVRLHFTDTDEQFVLKVTDSTITVVEHLFMAETPTGPTDIVFEEGFCHSGDAMELTKDLPIPDLLFENNYKIAKHSDKCGCAACGAIYSGDKVVDYTRAGAGDTVGTAFCPVCGAMAVVAETEHVKVNENNLWRWFRHLYGPDDMYKTHPQPHDPFFDD